MTDKVPVLQRAENKQSERTDVICTVKSKINQLALKLVEFEKMLAKWDKDSVPCSDKAPKKKTVISVVNALVLVFFISLYYPAPAVIIDILSQSRYVVLTFFIVSSLIFRIVSISFPNALTSLNSVVRIFIKRIDW